MTKLAIGICLDESSSMLPVRAQTIDGLNEYLSTIDPDARVTITKFSSLGLGDNYRNLCVNKRASSIKKLTTRDYSPNGNTPLYDAIGSTVKSLERWVDENGKKHTVLFVIQTDGQENSSRLWTRAAIADLIRYKEGEGWKFIYLGADQDQLLAERLANSIGLRAGQTMSYNTVSTAAVFDSVGVASASLSTNPTMSSEDLTEEAKKRYKQAGGKPVSPR